MIQNQKHSESSDSFENTVSSQDLSGYLESTDSNVNKYSLYKHTIKLGRKRNIFH